MQMLSWHIARRSRGILAAMILFLGLVVPLSAYAASTITEVSPLSSDPLKCGTSETVWDTSGNQCTVDVEVIGSEGCTCVREGDEDRLSEKGKSRTSSRAGLSARVICRGERKELNCAYKVVRVKCGGGNPTIYGPNDPKGDASVAVDPTHVNCGKSTKLYDGAAIAVTVKMTSLDGKCSAQVWAGTGRDEGPGGTLKKSALHTTLGKNQLYTFQNPTTLYGYCLGDGEKGCDFQVVAVEKKAP